MKIGIVSTVFAGMIGVAGFGAYNIVSAVGSSGGGGSGSSSGAQASSTPTTQAPLTAKQVTDTAADFLTAWSQGDLAGAAKFTDASATATQDLTGFRTGAHVTAVQAMASTRSTTEAASDTVPFTVDATISYQGLTDHWTYASSLTVGHGPDGKPAVRWAPSVLNPALTEGDSIVTGSAKAPELEVRDRNGVVMTEAQYPSLTRIFDDFRNRYGDKLSGGTPGIETYIQTSAGEQGKTLEILRKGRGARLNTTLDAHVQAAAERAVAGKTQAGVTAVDADTGGILAVAYSPAEGVDWALQDDVAPGSTFKVVTAAALLQHGMTPGSSAPCRNGANYGYGKPYRNDNGMNNASATLDWDFALSCNTGFILQAGRLGSDGLVATAAQFGLTQRWNVGTPVEQPAVPGGSGDELTSEMIGQGQLQMSPLIMASVAATARTGDFHQPRIVPSHLIDGPLAHAAGIPNTTSHQLRSMMHSAISYGTAAGVMSGFGSDSGAKTGSAEIDGAANPNGWFLGYSGHVAAAAVVQGGGHGNASAGPIVAAVLRAS
ncbi:penicillin-binding transpeptidase domain-containing protein [Actinacidiphila acididurans]|uniref:Penicillin-binding protein n=1 Tax=Actinacidiphila acididurans TaxID=2784346 RepID=A0ABS2TNY9_9ACTN|nr:penicillin-binding transpeptidase domain-containing protein [Actinacidiphila acididurans]MBM9505053.1 penicillin-binding protein [Actinacidiphila acididurans]